MSWAARALASVPKDWIGMCDYLFFASCCRFYSLLRYRISPSPFIIGYTGGTTNSASFRLVSQKISRPKELR